MSLKDMRDELRSLRKDTVKPVSRMKKMDIASEIEKLKSVRETTPAPAATPSTAPRKMKPAVESVKEAKAQQFPIAPAKAEKAGKAKAPKAEPKPEAEKKKSKMERLRELMAEESDSE